MYLHNRINDSNNKGKTRVKKELNNVSIYFDVPKLTLQILILHCIANTKQW